MCHSVRGGWISVQEGLCPGGACLGGGSLSRGVSVQGVSVWGVSVQRGFCQGDPWTDPPYGNILWVNHHFLQIPWNFPIFLSFPPYFWECFQMLFRLLCFVTSNSKTCSEILLIDNSQKLVTSRPSTRSFTKVKTFILIYFASIFSQTFPVQNSFQSFEFPLAGEPCFLFQVSQVFSEWEKTQTGVQMIYTHVTANRTKMKWCTSIYQH